MAFNNDTCPQKNPACYFMGRPCHFINNIAGHALDGLQRATGFDVEDVCGRILLV